jgi:hypothetical protein
VALKTITILQIFTLTEFRIIDWGMENCSLVLSIPHQNMTDTQVVIYGEASVEVSKLSIKKPLNRHTLSWNSRSPLGEHIATVPLSYGSHYSLPQFNCPSGSHFTFEISCCSCHINVTHSGETEDGGLPWNSIKYPNHSHSSSSFLPSSVAKLRVSWLCYWSKHVLRRPLHDHWPWTPASIMGRQIARCLVESTIEIPFLLFPNTYFLCCWLGLYLLS